MDSEVDTHTFVIKTLRSNLYSKHVRNADGIKFIPATELKLLITPDVVSQVLMTSRATRRRLLKRDSIIADRICAEEPRSYRKILAILVLSGPKMVHRLPDFFDHNIDDSRLPVPDVDDDDSAQIPAATRNDWRIVTKMWWDLEIDNFYQHQWRLLAPVFTEGQLRYNLTSNHVLPFMEREIIGSGGFGTVSRVRIHPDHHKFGTLEMKAAEAIFAVKEVRTDIDNVNDFENEIHALEPFRDAKIRHIIRLLASITMGTRRYLIFPWATGDLRLFFQKQEKFPDRMQLTLWIAEQTAGLARALSQIHEDMIKDRAPYKDSPITEAVFGLHGDIKQSNILWFDSSSSDTAHGLGYLVLADFGQAHSHRKGTRSRVEATNLAVTATYRAPEFDTSPIISRKADIWSLGCVFLETVIWLLEGRDAMRDEFTRVRMETGRGDRGWSSTTEDTFWEIVTSGSLGTEPTPKAEIKASVRAKMDRLRRNTHCSHYTTDFLALIENHMLEVSVDKRISALQLSQRLEALYLRCTQDAEYYRPMTTDKPETTAIPIIVVPAPHEEETGAVFSLAPKHNLGVTPVHEGSPTSLEPTLKLEPEVSPPPTAGLEASASSQATHSDATAISHSKPEPASVLLPPPRQHSLPVDAAPLTRPVDEGTARAIAAERSGELEPSAANANTKALSSVADEGSATNTHTTPASRQHRARQFRVFRQWSRWLR